MKKVSSFFLFLHASEIPLIDTWRFILILLHRSITRAQLFESQLAFSRIIFSIRFRASNNQI